MTLDHARPTAVAGPDSGGAARRVRPDRVALGLLLVGTAALYTVGLSRSRWGNAFYAGAAQAGAASWKAWFFGASDAGGAISVDKPPAALWVMGLSVRSFGLSSWSLLLPQALMGVLAVAVLAATVRRVLGPWPGVLAGLLLALAPMATLIFRFDNPDALLTLLLVLAGWAVTRGLADGRTRWLVLTGALVGLGFLTKSLQAFLVLPGLAGAYLVAGPPRLLVRLGQLLAAGVAVVVAGGWWLVVVQLVPRADRPWVGGTTDDNPLSLALGYNGLGRLSGDETAGGAGVHHGTGTVTRLIGSAADQAGWLLPAAGLALVAGLALTARAPRTDPARAAVLLWGGWAAVTAMVLSLMKGIQHSYYAVVLAPAVAGVIAVTATLLWRRDGWLPRLTLAVGVLASAAWAGSIVARHVGTALGLAPLVVALGALAVLGLIGRRRRWAAGLAVLAVCLGPLAWSVGTAARPQTGTNVVAAPPPTRATGWHLSARDATGVSSAALALIARGGAGYTWAAAVTGHRGAEIALDAGVPVMDIGGFAGQDPSISLSAFRADVAAHRVHYYVAGIAGGPDARAVMSWVTAHGTRVPAGSTQLYDLSGLATSTAGS